MAMMTRHHLMSQRTPACLRQPTIFHANAHRGRMFSCRQIVVCHPLSFDSIMTMTMSKPIVTPANSQEDNGDWLTQIESGVSLSDMDWEQLMNEKVSLFDFGLPACII
jgi:hypothetical protein